MLGLCFPAPSDGEVYRFVQLDEDLLAPLAAGELSFRGMPADPLVLCANDRTFAVLRQETSNTLLLLDPATGTILPTISGTNVLEPCRGDCTRVLERLETLPYGGPGAPDPHAEQRRALLTWRALQQDVPASDAEIRAALGRAGAYHLGDGSYCTLAAGYVARFWEILFNAMTLEEVGADDLSPSFAVRALAAFPDEYSLPIIGHLTAVFSVDGRIALSTVAVFFAHRILRERGALRYSEFRPAWLRHLQGHVVPTIEVLRGIALLDPVRNDDQDVSYFPRDRLAFGPEPRFAQLFRRRVQWKKDDLLVYLQDLGDAKTIDALVLKHCRQYDAGGAVVLSARHCTGQAIQ